MTMPIYRCTQQQLYTIATLGWNNCSRNLPLFAAFKPMYITAFIATQLQLITAASTLPGLAERNYSANLHHLQLTQAAHLCRSQYQILKRYISTAFPKSQLLISFNAAGQQYFAAASGHDWIAIQSLMQSAVKFATAHAAQLISNNNMPPEFPALLASTATNFTALHQAFLNDEETSKIATKSKIELNNQIYLALMAMFLDGQVIFRNEQSILSQFIFAHCLLLVRGSGTAGLRGSIKNASNNQPIAAAIITIGNDNYSTQSQIKGHFKISHTAAGTYSISVIAPGFQPFNIPNHEIITGTMSTLNVRLVPVVEP